MPTAEPKLQPAMPVASEQPTAREVKIGVIGYGYWGPKLARNFRELESSSVKAVSDFRADRLEECQRMYPEIAVTRDYRELLHSDVEAVVIATPVHAHYRLTCEALQAGKHVLVEKPITARSDQAQELVEMAAARGLTLMVGHTFEFNPAVEEVRAIVQSGELGKIYYMDSSRVNLGLLQPDINVIWDLAPHDISMIRFILGEDPVKVSARGAVFVNHSSKLHEVAYINMAFPDGVMANLRLSWLDPVKQRRLTVVGNKKMLVYDDIADDKIIIYDKGVEVPSYSVTEEEFRASYRHGAEAVHSFAWKEPLRAECAHFVECIRTGQTPRSDGLDGLKVVRILESAQRSLMNGGTELYVEY
jgi:predicted dehydrogenase